MARKSEIRAKAAAGLDALLKVSVTKDEQEAARLLGEAFEHLSEAAGILPEGKSLREVARDLEDEDEQMTPLREALDAAMGEPVAPVSGDRLMERPFGEDACHYLDEG